MSPIRAVLRSLVGLLLIVTFVAFRDASAAPATARPPGSPMLPVLLARVPLPGIKGHWGHPSVDYGSERVYLPAVDAGVLLAVDGAAGKVVGRIGGLKRPVAALVLPGQNRIVVSLEGSGELAHLDALSFIRLRSVPVPGGSGNLSLDLHEQKIYVSTRAGSLEVFQWDSLTHAGSLALGGVVEGFQISRSLPLLLACNPLRGVVAVFDRARGDTLSAWSLHGAQGNFPLALDDRHRRAFVGCRKPLQIMVLDMKSGQVVDSMRVGAGVEDLWYDQLRGRIFATCADGSLWTYAERRDGTYAPIGVIRTARGAGTSVFILALNRLYLIAPALGRRPAELLIFKTD